MTLSSEFEVYQWLALAIAALGLILPFWARRLPLASRSIAWLPLFSTATLVVGFFEASSRMIPVFKATGAVSAEQKMAAFEHAFESAGVRSVLVTSTMIAVAVLAFCIRYFWRHRVATDQPQLPKNTEPTVG